MLNRPCLRGDVSAGCKSFIWMQILWDFIWFYWEWLGVLVKKKHSRLFVCVARKSFSLKIYVAQTTSEGSLINSNRTRKCFLFVLNVFCKINMYYHFFFSKSFCTFFIEHTVYNRLKKLQKFTKSFENYESFLIFSWLLMFSI